MKKIKILTTLSLIALIIGAVVLHSCKKQETQNLLPTDSQLKDYTIYNKLSSFREKMDFHKETPTFDDWWYGDDEGGCEDNPAPGSDAAQEFNAAYPQIPITEEYTLVQPIQKTITGGEEWLRRPDDELDNEYDYYIYRVSEDILGFDYDEHCCLISEEMDQYYQDLDYVLQALVFDQPDIPPTHEFIRFVIAEGINPTGTNNYFHRFECTFALKCDRPINDPAITL
jgi:hypothetical protein